MENATSSSRGNTIENVDEQSRSTFYRKTYMHVALAVILFIALESILLKIEPLVAFMLSLTQGYKWLILLAVFWLGSSMSHTFTHSTNRGTQYMGLFFYVLLEALIFVPLLAIGFSYINGPEMLNQAGVVSLGLFAGLSGVVFLTNTNFSFLRTAITIGFFIAMALIVGGMLFGFDLGLWFSVAMVVLAAGSILYQTSQLKYEYHTDQYVGAAIALFASLMFLFWYVVQIFMSRD